MTECAEKLLILHFEDEHVVSEPGFRQQPVHQHEILAHIVLLGVGLHKPATT